MWSILTALASVAVAMLGPAWPVQAEETPRRATVPANVIIHESLRDELEELMAASATLRRQLAAVAAAPTRVDIRVSMAPVPGGRRAQSEINRYSSGFLEATVIVPSGYDFVELLAHELEHVVEQIEGVSLAALEREGRAYRDPRGFFETDRASEAGRAAAAEVAGH